MWKILEMETVYQVSFSASPVSFAPWCQAASALPQGVREGVCTWSSAQRGRKGPRASSGGVSGFWHDCRGQQDLG
jgi:hypothetical protein